MSKKTAAENTDLFDRDLFEDDFADSDGDTSEKHNKKRGKFRFGRFLLFLVIAVFVFVNAWTFIDMLQFELLVVSVEVNLDKLNLFEEEAHTLYAEVRSYGLGETLGLSQPEIIWDSSDGSIVSVNSDGTIQAIAPGTAVITAAEAKSGLSAECTVTVHDLTDIVLNIDKEHLGVGESLSLEAAVGGTAPEEPFEYTSSDSSIAEVDQSGNVIATGAGEAVITVSARGYTDGTCVVSVSDAPTELLFDSENGSICLGESRTLGVSMKEGEYCSRYIFSSSAPDVLSIDDNGKIEALTTGNAVITVSAYNGVENSLEFTVSSAPKSIELERSKISIYSGDSIPLEVSDNTGACSEYYFTSSDPAVASVDKYGIVTAHNRGQAEITCTSYNGKTDTCTVNVTIVCYTVPYTSDRVQQNIEALVSTYPELISSEVVGKSVQGRDITLVKIGTGEKKALVVAGLHSRENVGVTFTMRCLEEYADAYYNGSGKYGSYNLRDIFSRYTLYVVPLMNPDGLDISTSTENPLYTTEEIDRAKYKNNANGVNLNRNFPFMWGYADPEDADKVINITTPDTLSYAGASAGSEPETQAMMALCNANEFEWLLDIHCRGNIMYYQDEYNEVTKADNRLASQLSRKCGFTLMNKSDAYEISGGFENWFRSEFGKPGICLELVKPEFSYVVNERFEDKLNWSRTRYAFLLGMTE